MGHVFSLTGTFTGISWYYFHELLLHPILLNRALYMYIVVVIGLNEVP